MRCTFWIIVCLLLPATALHAQGRLHIASDADAAFTLTGFDAFSTFDIARVDLSGGRDTIINNPYRGLALMRYGNGSVYPLIMEDTETKIIFPNDSPLPVFPDGGENLFLYGFLTSFRELSARAGHLQYLLAGAEGDEDSLSHFREELGLVNSRLDSLKAGLPEPDYPLASLFLRGRMLIESSYSIRTHEELQSHKGEFLTYIREGFPQLRYSDLIQETGRQYMMMNEYVLSGKDVVNQTRINDVADWTGALAVWVEPAAVVDFFVGAFYGRSMVTQASAIAGSFAGIVISDGCVPVPFEICDTIGGLILTDYEGLRTENMDDWDVDKVLSLVSEDDMVSLAETVSLVRDITTEGLFLPLVVVPAEPLSLRHLGMRSLCQGFLFFATDESRQQIFPGSPPGLPCFLLLDSSNRVLICSSSRKEIIEYAR
jgi:hypothetical protein